MTKESEEPRPLLYRRELSHASGAQSASDFVSELISRDHKRAVSVDDGSQVTPVSELYRETIMQDRTVAGLVDLTGQTVKKRLTIRNCRFRDEVDLSSVTCESDLSLDNCIFEQGIALKGARIKGALFIACDARSPEGESPAINGARLHVGGNLNCAGILARGSVVFSQSNVAGVVSLQSEPGDPGFEVHGNVDLDKLRAEDLFIHGVKVHWKLSNGKEVDGQLLVEESTIRQSIKIVSAEEASVHTEVRNIRLKGTVVEGTGVWIGNVDVKNNFDARFLRVGVGGGVRIDTENLGAKIEGDLLLEGAHVGKLLRIGPCTIRGNVRAPLLTAGEVKIQSNWPVPLKERDEDTKSKEEQVVSIYGSVDFSDANIAGEVYFIGVNVGGQRSEGGTRTEQFSLNLRRAHIGGDLAFFPDLERCKAYGIMPEDLPRQRMWTRLAVGINLEKAQLGGDVDMSNVDCGNGVVRLTDASVAGNIAILEQKIAGPEHEIAGNRTAVRALIMDGLVCRGGVDITGLTVAEGKIVSDREDDHTGHVLARENVQISKDLRVGAHKRGGDRGSSICAANIPGRLDLGFSRLGGLEVSSNHFEGIHEGRSCNDACFERCLRKHGIILNRARIGKLSVHVESDDETSAFPRPIDLGYTDIRWWEFCTGVQARTASNHAHYTKLLEGDRKIQRHVWASIERSFSDRGMDRAADQIHIEMRKRLRQKEKVEAFFDFLTASTTSPWRILLGITVWLVASWYLFSIPQNIGPSELALAPRPTTVAVEYPQSSSLGEQARLVLVYPSDTHPRGWTIGDAMWMALRYHVPILAFSVQEGWEPASQDGVRAGRFVALFSPEQYANFVLLVHWLLWPIVLIIATKRFLRRARD